MERLRCEACEAVVALLDPGKRAELVGRTVCRQCRHPARRPRADQAA